jgi:pimeloyl-ACP methyl ester carboxylesterase
MLRSFCDGSVFADRIGAERPALVALHGWGRDRSDLAGCVEGYDALSLDLPGFGASPAPPTAWSSADYAELVSLVITEATDAPVVLLGHSFGGRVALCLAAAHPEQVGGLALTGVPLPRPDGGPPARSPLGYRVIKRLHRSHLVSDEVMERARRRHGSADYRNATGVMRDVLVRLVHENYDQELSRLRGPVELVWGELDTAAPLRGAQRAEAMLAEAGVAVRLTVDPGGNHDTPLRHPAELRAGLDRLLLEHSR